MSLDLIDVEIVIIFEIQFFQASYTCHDFSIRIEIRRDKAMD